MRGSRMLAGLLGSAAVACAVMGCDAAVVGLGVLGDMVGQTGTSALADNPADSVGDTANDPLSGATVDASVVDDVGAVEDIGDTEGMVEPEGIDPADALTEVSGDGAGADPGAGPTADGMGEGSDLNRPPLPDPASTPTPQQLQWLIDTFGAEAAAAMLGDDLAEAIAIAEATGQWPDGDQFSNR